MSSQGSPTLDLDVRFRRLERVVALTMIVLALSAPWSLDHALWLEALFALWAGGFVAWSVWRAGWVGTRHRLARIVWLDDGRWLLTDYRGDCIEATLCTNSRRTSGCVWLQWVGKKRYSLLLGKGDLRSPELRRLLVRLAIDGGRRPMTTVVEDTVPRWSWLRSVLPAALASNTLLPLSNSRPGKCRDAQSVRQP